MRPPPHRVQGHHTPTHRVRLAPPAAITPTDRAQMRRALDLARRGLGATAPNPAVGCVVTDAGGTIIGEGYHPRAGEPHAEVFALRAAGRAAAGGTAYVTLEPCAHHGRTPPCAAALLDAGVARVVVGVGDPNPLVGGGGLRLLVDGGVEVECVGGEEEEEVAALNPVFMAEMRKQATEGSGAAAA